MTGIGVTQPGDGKGAGRDGEERERVQSWIHPFQPKSASCSEG